MSTTATRLDTIFVLRRTRSGGTDCYVDALVRNGDVISLFVKNGLSRRKPDQNLDQAGFGWLQCQWRPGRQPHAGRFLRIEGRVDPGKNVAVHHEPAVEAVLQEILGMILHPGMQDAQIGDWLWELTHSTEALDARAILSLFLVTHMAATESPLCPACNVGWLEQKHSLPVLQDGILVCTAETPHLKRTWQQSMQTQLSQQTGHVSKFLPLVRTQQGSP